MRMRLFVAMGAVLTVGSLAGPAAATASPTLTLTRDCSAYPPFHEFVFSLGGFPPNTPFFPTLTFDGTSFGPATGFSTDGAGNYTLAGLGSSEPAMFTLKLTGRAEHSCSPSTSTAR
jgi:hypothetical protein